MTSVSGGNANTDRARGAVILARFWRAGPGLPVAVLRTLRGWTDDFTDRSMLRVVHRERAIALLGPRALLMQAAHPLAVSGLLAHSTALDEPYDRLARTAEVMGTFIGFGSRGPTPTA